MLSPQYSKPSLASSPPDSPSLPHAQHSGLHRCQPWHFPRLDTLSFTSLSLRPPWVTPSLLGYSSTPSRSGSGATFSRKSFTSWPGVGAPPQSTISCTCFHQSTYDLAAHLPPGSPGSISAGWVLLVCTCRQHRVGRWVMVCWMHQ